MKVPCSDVQPRENDKAVVWNPCNAVHLRILSHVQIRASSNMGRSVQIRARGGPCKSVQWGSMHAMGSVVP